MSIGTRRNCLMNKRREPNILRYCPFQYKMCSPIVVNYLQYVCNVDKCVLCHIQHYYYYFVSRILTTVTSVLWRHCQPLAHFLNPRHLQWLHKARNRTPWVSSLVHCLQSFLPYTPAPLPPPREKPVYLACMHGSEEVPNVPIYSTNTQAGFEGWGDFPSPPPQPPGGGGGEGGGMRRLRPHGKFDARRAFFFLQSSVDWCGVKERSGELPLVSACVLEIPESVCIYMYGVFLWIKHSFIRKDLPSLCSSGRKWSYMIFLC